MEKGGGVKEQGKLRDKNREPAINLILEKFKQSYFNFEFLIPLSAT